MTEGAQKNTAKAIIVSSVSGGGKTTIINQLLDLYPELSVAITATSREPRPGEEDGKHYYFYSRAEFSKLLEQNEFLEHAEVHGNYYGVPTGATMARLNEGDSIFLNIDIQGMASVRERLGTENVVTIFILPPDEKTWEERLRSRETDSEESIKRRLEDGRQELSHADDYDYRIINDELETAVQDAIRILTKENVLKVSNP